MTVFFSALNSGLGRKLTGQGLSADEATSYSDQVTQSAGAMIEPLSQNPATAVVADTAREAMSQALAYGSFLAAGFLVLGLVATLFIPNIKMHDDDEERIQPKG